MYFKALHVLQASSFLKGQPIILFPLLLSIFSRTTPSVKVVLWSLWKKTEKEKKGEIDYHSREGMQMYDINWEIEEFMKLVEKLLRNTQ